MVGEAFPEPRALRAQLLRHQDQEKHRRPEHGATLPLRGPWLHAGKTDLHLGTKVLHDQSPRY